MIRTRPRRGGGTLLAVFLLGFDPAVWAAQFTLGELMSALAGHRYGAASFTERKYMSILDQPLESSGELRFVPPDRLEKRTQKPQLETLVLDGDTLSIERAAHKHVLQLKDYPEVAGMILGVRATLAGDRQALERVYQLDLQGSRERWTLVLRPRESPAARVIAHIRMEGARDEMRTVEILLADGDRSVMSIREGGAR
jgi:hypothetical protein